MVAAVDGLDIAIQAMQRPSRAVEGLCRFCIDLEGCAAVPCGLPQVAQFQLACGPIQVQRLPQGGIARVGVQTLPVKVACLFVTLAEEVIVSLLLEVGRHLCMPGSISMPAQST